jgi:bacteriocin biosynthesis cyclodehydratase domain-containing protein
VLERGGEGSARIASRHVAIVGAGPLGARIARSVAALRPRVLELVDETAAAGRQNGGGTMRAGAAALAASISAEGFANVAAREGDAGDESAMRELLDASDLVILALNAYSPATLHRLNELAIAHETPWMAVYFDGSDAVIGPLHVPGESPCHLEVEIQTEASVGIRDDYLVYKESLDADPRLDAFVLPAHLDTAAGLAASAALRFLVSGHCFCVGRSVRVDFERMAVDSQEFLRLPRCPACVGLRPAYQHEFL